MASFNTIWKALGKEADDIGKDLVNKHLGTKNKSIQKTLDDILEDFTSSSSKTTSKTTSKTGNKINRPKSNPIWHNYKKPSERVTPNQNRVFNEIKNESKSLFSPKSPGIIDPLDSASGMRRSMNPVVDIRIPDTKNNVFKGSPILNRSKRKTQKPTIGPLKDNLEKELKSKFYDKDKLQKQLKESQKTKQMDNFFNNKYTKTAIGAGVSGAIVLNMFNNGGQMSNSELYGQQQRY